MEKSDLTEETKCGILRKTSHDGLKKEKEKKKSTLDRIAGNRDINDYRFI